MLTISGRAVGSRRPLFAEFSLPLPPDLGEGGGGESGVTLRDVIERIVREEVAAFRRRESDRQMVHALTARQIEEGALRGKIESGGAEREPQDVDEDAAVAAALTAFEDGLYMVVIDDQQQRELDRQIFLHNESRITFVRLTMLAGG